MISDIVAFIQQMAGSSTLELIAVTLGLINITLIIRRSVWNFPFGMVMVAIYSHIFFDNQLYSDAALQIYFFAMQLYGWWYWLKGRTDRGLIKVASIGARRLTLVFAGCGLGTLALGTLVGQLSDAAFPYWDGSIAVLSVTAQFLMSRRYIENWVLWILVDVLAVGLFYAKGLYPTAALYTVFLVMATMGLLQWQRAKRRQGSPSAMLA